MSSSQPPRPRPTPSPAADAVTDGAPPADDSDVLSAPKRRRRLNPLRRRRRDAEPAAEHDEWDDEYDDDLEDEYDDGYDDDEPYEDEYDDAYDEEDEYEDDDDGPYEDDAPTAEPRRRGRRRLLPRARRRTVAASEPAPGPTAPVDAVDPPDLEKHDSDDQDKPASRRRLGGRPGGRLGGRRQRGGGARPASPLPGRRTRRKVPVAAFREGAGRRLTGARTGVSGAGRRVGAGVGRGWAGTRTGAGRAAHFARTHWGRAAYLYLGFVGAALLVTLLLYWHSGFTYDECNSCGIPVLFSVSPWWLLIVPFNLAAWPMLLPLLILLPFAILNAELINRFSKRPQPLYRDWD